MAKILKSPAHLVAHCRLLLLYYGLPCPDSSSWGTLITELERGIEGTKCNTIKTFNRVFPPLPPIFPLFLKQLPRILFLLGTYFSFVMQKRESERG